MLSVYVANLAKYNEGHLVGDWISLPTDGESLTEKIDNILGNDEEYAIHDYENAPFKINEYEDVYKLNEYIQEINSYDSNVIEALNDSICDKEELKDILVNNDFTYVEDVHNYTELAEKVDTELLPFDYDSIEKAGATHYIDWETVGMEMSYDGWYISKNNVAVYVYR